MSQVPVFYLVYASAAKELYSQVELLEILEKFRTNNFKTDITGLLLYYEGNFFHIVEGEEPLVEQLFEAHVLSDRRLCQVLKLLTGYESHRSFPDWSMGFQRAERTIVPNDFLPNFNELLESRSAPESIYPDIHEPLLTLLHGFYRSSGFSHDRAQSF